MLSDYADMQTMGELGAQNPAKWIDFYKRVAWLSTQPSSVQNQVLSELRQKSPDVYHAVLYASRNLRSAAQRLRGLGELDGFFEKIGKFFKKVADGAKKAIQKVGAFIAPVAGAFSPIAGGIVGSAVAAAGGNPDMPGTAVPAVMPPVDAAQYALTPAIVTGEAPPPDAGGTIAGVPVKWLLAGAGVLLLVSITSRR